MKALFLFLFLFLFLLFIIPFFSYSQQIVEDRANNAQLKKMVDQSWDEWEPTPATNWLGIPENLDGYIYWRVLHREYWKGEDQRPYRSDGPFWEDYSALTAQYAKDQDIRDTAEAIMKTNLSTLTNQSGGSLDVAYQLFFKNKYEDINNEITNLLLDVSKYKPLIFDELTHRTGFINYIEQFEVFNSRIDGIHNSMMDKGKRITSYLEIMKQFEYKKLTFFQYVDMFVKMSSLPTPTQIDNSNVIPYNSASDKEIVNKIMKNYSF